MSYVIIVRDQKDNKQFIGPFDTVEAANTWIDNNPHRYAFVYPLAAPTGDIPKASPAKPPQKEFHFGKYRGQTIESVMLVNPQYIRWAYDNVDGHAGITADEYRKAGGSLPDPLPGPSPADKFPDDDIPF